MLQRPVRVCFVCSGNICRSPTAEVVLNKQAAEAGLSAVVVADSAGTGSWHEGDDMDERSRATMHDAGYDVPLHVAKQFRSSDFATRDLVVSLDSGHQNVLWWLAVETADVAAARAKTIPLRHFDPLLRAGEKPDVRTTAGVAGSPRCWPRWSAAVPNCCGRSSARSPRAPARSAFSRWTGRPGNP